jgi:hypothetical protein
VCPASKLHYQLLGDVNVFCAASALQLPTSCSSLMRTRGLLGVPPQPVAKLAIDGRRSQTDHAAVAF